MKKYLIGNILVNTVEPREYKLDRLLKNQLIDFFNQTEMLYDVPLNRIRFDLAETKDGKYKVFELNLRNPIGLFTGYEVLKLWNKKYRSTKKTVMDIFLSKTAVLIISDNELENSELRILGIILARNDIEFLAVSPQEAVQYVDNDDYVIWFTKATDKLTKYFSGKKNVFGGFIGTKADLISENYNSELLISSQILKTRGTVIPTGKVAKIVSGPRALGGKGVFFEKEVVEFDDMTTLLLQDEVDYINTIDINVYKLRTDNGIRWGFNSFRRVPGPGAKLANLSQQNGGYYEVHIN